MSEQTVTHAPVASAEEEVEALYRRALHGWNARDAAGMAGAFAEDGESIGFDGSVVTGRREIESHLRQIFADHQTAAYVAKLRGVRLLAADVGVLRAVAGMVPPGKTDLNPAVNAVQTVVATRRDGQWQIAQLQNTPAQFHGRPELARELTDELRQLI